MKLLVVSGGNHPYEETTPILESFLAAAGHDVTVTERSTILGSQAIGDYDCLVFNTLRAGDLAVEQGLVLTEDERTGMTRFIAGGKGFVCIHVSAQRPDDWPEFHQITGGGWITRVCKHAPYGRFSVDVRQADHPCSQGITAFETDDELYYECPGLPLQLGWMPGERGLPHVGVRGQVEAHGLDPALRRGQGGPDPAGARRTQLSDARVPEADTQRRRVDDQPRGRTYRVGAPRTRRLRTCR